MPNSRYTNQTRSFLISFHNKLNFSVAGSIREMKKRYSIIIPTQTAHDWIKTK